MRLNKARIQTYRSIVDSGEVDIEENVTVIIGKNEQGKTNFLRGIRGFNTDQAFSPADLPNHLRPSLEDRRADELPIVSLWFTLDQADRKRLSDVVEDISSVIELKCIKYYGNNYGYFVCRAEGMEEPLRFALPDISGPVTQIKGAVQQLKSKLESHAQRLPTFASNMEKVGQITASLLSADLRDANQVDNIIKTFTTSIKGLTAQDQPITDDITAAVNELETARTAIQSLFQGDRSRSLRQHLPYFVLHSTKTDQIPNEVKIQDFIKDPVLTSKGMSNLCNAAPFCAENSRTGGHNRRTSSRSLRRLLQGHNFGWIKRILDTGRVSRAFQN